MERQLNRCVLEFIRFVWAFLCSWEQDDCFATLLEEEIHAISSRHALGCCCCMPIKFSIRHGDGEVKCWVGEGMTYRYRTLIFREKPGCLIIGADYARRSVCKR